MKSYDLSKLNILVLEKHLLIRKLLTDVFSEFGVASVFTTPDPEKAFDYHCTMEPDLVLCDWTPDLDGMTFMQELRWSKFSPNPYIPIVVVTASTELRHIYTARDNGMTEFLAKPISAKTLYPRICAIIENPRPFIRTGQFFGPDRRRRANGFSGVDRRRAANL